jgi:hypothetical protein
MPALIQLAAAALIAGQQFDASAPARQTSADQAITRDQICYRLATAETYPFDLRNCLAFAHSPNAAFKMQVCNFLKETDQLADFEFTSYAACMSSSPPAAE